VAPQSHYFVVNRIFTLLTQNQEIETGARAPE
jgi:hypothetical protein